ncbi:MAG TPA: hypothetical protein VGA61_02995 [Anaerolineae bacterium]
MRFVRLVLLVALLAAWSLAASPTAALAAPAALTGNQYCPTGTIERVGVFDTGAKWLICLPPGPFWNGDLVVFAHGYTPVTAPLDFQSLKVPAPGGGVIDVPQVVTGLGYAFATTSYRVNGLAVLEGVKDVKQLSLFFPEVAQRRAAHTYLAGFSEGALVATLSLEASPNVYSGALAACGPIGDFQKQTNYLGDFRVLFDVFYPNVLPPTAIKIPPILMANWYAAPPPQPSYTQKIAAALVGNPANAQQLIATSQAAVDPLVQQTIGETTIGVLWYNAFATNDATAKLGGNPFDNSQKVYVDPLNTPQFNALLNQNVARFSESPKASLSMRKYQTSGQLTRRLVTLHNTADPIVPYWHEGLYQAKVQASGAGSWLTPMTVNRYGHCNFTLPEVLAAFQALVK